MKSEIAMVLSDNNYIDKINGYSKMIGRQY
jgi:hypothetical protein